MSKKHNHPKLIVNMFGEQLGNLFFNDNGQLSFAYSNEHDSRILSISMPDRSTVYAGTVVEKWFFGVLPDGESVRRAMAKGKEYGHNSVFGLLADYGADLPGAIQVFSPDTLEQIKSESSYKSVSPEEISERIKTMVSESRRHVSMSWHGAHEHWSLAGGQPKFALMKDDDGKYYECLGDALSNVIVKPGVLDMDEQASIEHLTMSIAKKSGLPVARSSIVDFAGTSAIVVERYDRETDASGKIARRHQEDFCQALGLLPSQKYMEGKNPTVEAGTMLLKYCGERSLASFVDSILFNYLIGGTDGHLKNHSLLHMGNGEISMAPLYDIASQFPYMRENQITHLALGIGTEKRIGRVGKKALSDMARHLNLPAKDVFARFAQLSEEVPKATESVLSTSTHIPHIDRIAASMLPRVQMNCEYAAKNLNTTHFLVPNLFEATEGFSLSDGNEAADLQQELAQQGDELVLRDPVTGVVSQLPAREGNGASSILQNMHHAKRTYGTGRASGEGSVYVSPHVRGGVKVSGYWRARPHRK